MGRLSGVERAKYEPVSHHEGDDKCYFCRKGAISTEDLTPWNGASDSDKERFQGRWIRVGCCASCWKRIYSVNVFQGAARYNVPRGCMTLLQKEDLLGADTAKRAFSEATSLYSFGFHPQRIVPNGSLQMDDGNFVWNSLTVYRDEMDLLQGPLGLKMLRFEDESVISKSVLSMCQGGDLDFNRIPVYAQLLGVSIDVS